MLYLYDFKFGWKWLLQVVVNDCVDPLPTQALLAMEVEEKREKEWRGSVSDRDSSSKKASRLHRICQQRLEIAVNTSQLIKFITLYNNYVRL